MESAGNESVTPPEAAAPTALNLAPMRELLRIDREIDRLEAETKELNVRRKLVEQAALAELAAQGCRSIPLTDDAGLPVSIYILSKLSTTAKAGTSSEDRIAALESAGLGWLIKPGYDAMKLGAWVREQLQQNEKLPEPLVGAFDFTPFDQVVTKTTTRKESATALAAKNLRAQQSAG